MSYDEQSAYIHAYVVSVDDEYIETLGLEIIAGRNFSKDFGTDSLSRFIVDERVIRELDIKSPLYQRVIWYDDDSTYRGEIRGIVKDFHYKSLHVNISPLVLMVKPSEYNYLLVRITPENISRTLNAIEKEWQTFDDLFTFEYSFLAAVIITEIIAILAVTYLSIRASRLKPVDSLRYE